jgi:hypothetical protein
LKFKVTYKITCPFTVKSSHEIHDVGFRGGSSITLSTPIKFFDPLGSSNTSLEIIELNEKNYQFEILSRTLSSRDVQVEFVQKVSDYLSFLMARRELNPQYGNCFIAPEWLAFMAVRVVQEEGAKQDESGAVQMRSVATTRDSWQIQSERKLVLNSGDLGAAAHVDLMRFYVDGLRAEHGKSKYFHWFLILEYLENSEAYKSLFFPDKLFDPSEIEKVVALANTMAPVKKGALLNLLSRTREFRNSKLVTMLSRLGITQLKGFQTTIDVSEDLIKGITQGRNALFHSGSSVSEDVLYKQLFPLATLVVEHVSSNPNCLEP